MTTISVVPLESPAEFRAYLDDLVLLDPKTTIGAVLVQRPFLFASKLSDDILSKQIGEVSLVPVIPSPSTALYAPPGWSPKSASGTPRNASSGNGPIPGTKNADTSTPQESRVKSKVPAQRTEHPLSMSDSEAALLAYGLEIDRVASFLRSNLSVLIVAEKLVVEYLWQRMVQEANRRPVLLEVPDDEPGELGSRGLRQRQLGRLKTLIKDLKTSKDHKTGDVLVIRHLDLLAGGGESNLSTESRELIELVYQSRDQVLLAFADRSLELPEVLAARFAVRFSLLGLPKDVIHPNGDVQLVGQALITKDEAARFEGFTPDGLYKNVAGMNPVRFRHALRYAVDEFASNDGHKAPVQRLYQALRSFKAQTSAKFEVPNVKFTDIGGYDSVKATLLQALTIMAGAGNLQKEELRRELIPRGFLFYGPPGTGKTLFAKAVANEMNATIQIVSGPEVTDMYVGESERKVRELFAEARRNAPAVLVFDEFDSIASKRSGRDDGGSRAGNALVAQILTEMDGFRPDVPMLVIGTTNRLDIIDPALLRPSRFREVSISLPDLKARRAIAAVHSAHFGIDASPELLDLVAEYTAEFNGDEIRSLFRDACVGKYYEHPPIPPDARRIGYLVGKLRHAAQQREAEAASQRSSYQQSRLAAPQQSTSGNLVALGGQSMTRQTISIQNPAQEAPKT